MSITKNADYKRWFIAGISGGRMKKVLIFLALLFCGVAHAGPMANVEYVHKVIAQQWGITIPYNPALETPQVAVNMKYLLTTVDVANKILNKESTTNYGNGEYATMAAADTIATNEASDRLIKIEPKFFVTTTADTTEFSFSMSAKGVFQIDWGDGNMERVVRTDTESTTYSHTYATADEYEIGIGGYTTGYSINTDTAAISFAENKRISGIAGSLGAVFPTLSDGAQPRFYKTFSGCTNLAGAIPENLFAGITGMPADQMFSQSFVNCTGLTGCIPDGLFAGIDTTLDKIIADDDPFNGTALTLFACSALAPKFFATTTAANSEFTFYMSAAGTFSIDWGDGIIEYVTRTDTTEETYSHTYATTAQHTVGIGGWATEYAVTTTGAVSFRNNMEITGIDGSLGAIFGTIGDGSAKNQQPNFHSLFQNNYKLKGAIPDALFTGVYGVPNDRMFYLTFAGCSQITSIPGTLFSGITTSASNLFSNTFSGCSSLTEIPDSLFATIIGAPQAYMFYDTFKNCTKLSSVPANLFSGISGTLNFGAFSGTFNGCTKLSGCIPDSLFANIKDVPTVPEKTLAVQQPFRNTNMTEVLCSSLDDEAGGT